MMSSTHKEGWLTKKGGIMPNWQKRWFVLDPDELTLKYYDKPENGKRGNWKKKGVVTLSHITGEHRKCIRLSHAPHANSMELEIQTEKRTFRLRAFSMEERDQWIVAVRTCCGTDTHGAAESAPTASKYRRAKSKISRGIEVGNRKLHEKLGGEMEDPEAIYVDGALRFTFLHSIGGGSYGEVKKAVGLNGRYYAIKIIKGTLRGKRQLSTYEDPNHEIAVMKKLIHPCLCDLLDVINGGEQVYIVNEYLSGGTLEGWRASYAVENKRVPLDELRPYMRDVIFGLDYLHSHNISHRDMKPENVVLHSEGHCKIIDFGAAQMWEPPSDTTASKKNLLADHDNMENEIVGTPAFLAPEICDPESDVVHSKPLDLWAVGVILYQMFYNELPYTAKNSYLLYDLIASTPVTYPDVKAPSKAAAVEYASYRALVQSLLQKDPLKRIGTLSMIKTATWLSHAGGWGEQVGMIDALTEADIEAAVERKVVTREMVVMEVNKATTKFLHTKHKRKARLESTSRSRAFSTAPAADGAAACTISVCTETAAPPAAPCSGDGSGVDRGQRPPMASTPPTSTSPIAVMAPDAAAPQRQGTPPTRSETKAGSARQTALGSALFPAPHPRRELPNLAALPHLDQLPDLDLLASEMESEMAAAPKYVPPSLDEL